MEENENGEVKTWSTAAKERLRQQNEGYGSRSMLGSFLGVPPGCLRPYFPVSLALLYTMRAHLPTRVHSGIKVVRPTLRLRGGPACSPASRWSRMCRVVGFWEKR
ncbi:hypothetical protein Pyn_37841 [Prunus yedoensis var. nudiflora]|uniref:Uncharacterized protein n=1 Tax=Prunus yedoensis var. nudiflora TaxID=2094558 RepID=A0A314UZA7_PRUYE|nr:hypothetical protein Pyn_37841 [Prunus yedoensis var. nudiflora]